MSFSTALEARYQRLGIHTTKHEFLTSDILLHTKTEPKVIQNYFPYNFMYKSQKEIDNNVSSSKNL